MPSTHYEILGVSENASCEEIDRAYQSKVNFYLDLSEHPTNHLQRLSIAKDVLCDEVKRRAYDRKLESNSATATANHLGAMVVDLQRIFLREAEERANKRK